MKIWIDADACPVEVKEIVYRAAERVQVQVTLVANSFMRIPRSPWISLNQVPAGLDVADTHIVDEVAEGDLVITADIPLAARLVPRQVIVIDPRGEQYTESNIAQRLSVRDLMAELRGAGMVTGGPRPYGLRDRQAFASTFDRELQRALRRSSSPPA